VVCTLVYVTTPLRDFRPTLLGKANTVAQIVTLGATILVEVAPWFWVALMKWIGVWTVFSLTIVSALHYVYLLGVRLRSAGVQDRAGARSA
jgi:cardiolipin synthase